VFYNTNQTGLVIVNLGKYWAEVAKLAQERINNDTSILSGYKLKISYQEDNFTNAGVIQGATEAIRRGSLAILGPTTNAMGLALQYYIGALRIPNIAFSFATAELFADKAQYPTFMRLVRKEFKNSK